MGNLINRVATWFIQSAISVVSLPFMAVATADTATRERGMAMRIDVYPCAVDIIFKGTIVAINAAGFLAPAGDTAATFVVGIAEKNVDNSGGSAGDLSCPVRSGVVVRLAAEDTTMAQTSVGETATAEDDLTVGLAADTTNDISVGRIVEFVSATEVWVFIPPCGAIA